MTTSTLAAIPTPHDVRIALGDLLGRDVRVDPAEAFAGDLAEGSTFGVYVDDRLQPRVVVVLDGALSARLAGAIGLVPTVGVEEAVRSGTLSPVLRENLGEVLNVLSALLNASDHPHVRLHAIHDAAQPPYPAVLAWAATLGRRLDLTVALPQYGAGRLSLVGIL